MQNPFYVGDNISISSSDGESSQSEKESVTIEGDEGNNDDTIGAAVQGSAAQQQSATEARRGQRARMPRTLFQSK